ncbi:MAG: thioredoxin-dependent thiol peroxidase [Tetrasphaera sp.]
MTDRLQPGDRAPDFTLPDDTGTDVSLDDLRGHKVIVYFYPKAMTAGCTTQACDFSDSLAGWQADGFEVVGISPDSPAALAKFRAKEGLGIRLLADPAKEALTAWGAFGEKKNYGKVVQGVIRSTFVLDEQGVITHAWYNVKAAGHVAKLRRDLGLDQGSAR